MGLDLQIEKRRDRVRSVRRSLRISQASVASHSGVPRAKLSLFENGHLDLSADELQSVEQTLGRLASQQLQKIRELGVVA